MICVGRTDTRRNSARLTPKTCTSCWRKFESSVAVPLMTSAAPETSPYFKIAALSSPGYCTPSMYFFEADPPWNRSATRSAPSEPRIVLMKNRSKPVVLAWVRTKNPTPKVMPASVISMACFFASRNRTAMRKVVLTG